MAKERDIKDAAGAIEGLLGSPKDAAPPEAPKKKAGRPRTFTRSEEVDKGRHPNTYDIEKAAKGTVPYQIFLSPELRKAVKIAALNRDISMSAWFKEAAEEKLKREQ